MVESGYIRINGGHNPTVTDYCYIISRFQKKTRQWLAKKPYNHTIKVTGRPAIVMY